MPPTRDTSAWNSTGVVGATVVVDLRGVGSIVFDWHFYCNILISLFVYCITLLKLGIILYVISKTDQN